VSEALEKALSPLEQLFIGDAYKSQKGGGETKAHQIGLGKKKMLLYLALEARGGHRDQKKKETGGVTTKKGTGWR